MFNLYSKRNLKKAFANIEMFNKRWSYNASKSFETVVKIDRKLRNKL